MTGSHTYSSSTRHTITTTVVEPGNAPASLIASKFGDDPGGNVPWNARDVVRLPWLTRMDLHRKGNSAHSASHVVPLQGGTTPSPTVTHKTPRGEHPGHHAIGRPRHSLTMTRVNA